MNTILYTGREYDREAYNVLEKSTHLFYNMIHSETPFWLDSLFYVAYLLPIFIIRYFYYAKGIRFALINMIVDIIAIGVFDFISGLFELNKIVFYFILFS